MLHTHGRPASRAPLLAGRPFPTKDSRGQKIGTTRTVHTVKDADGQVTSRVRRTVLPGGLRVVTEQMAGARSASIGVWVNVGSRDETPTLHGCSHFLEHLLFKGTRERSALDISVALDAVGGEFNAFTAKEYTCFHARVLDEDLPLAVDVLGDMITNSLITARRRRGRARRDPRRDRDARRRPRRRRPQPLRPPGLRRLAAGPPDRRARIDSITTMTREQVRAVLPSPLPRRQHGGRPSPATSTTPRSFATYAARSVARASSTVPPSRSSPATPPRPAPSRRGSRTPRVPSSRSTSCSG